MPARRHGHGVLVVKMIRPITLSFLVLIAYGAGAQDNDADSTILAAERGDAAYQFILGIEYANGKGRPRDLTEAAKWFRLAAEQGHNEAQYRLGSMYAEGEGVLGDNAEAAKWYRLAADQGHAKASVALRRMGGCPYEPGSRELSQEKQKIIAKLNERICQMALDNDFSGIWSILRGIGKNYAGEEITVLEAYPYIRCSGFFTLDLDLLRVIAQYPSRDLLMIYLISYLADEQACSPTFLRKLVTCRKDMFERSDCLNIFEHIDHKRRKHSQSPDWVERYNRFESYLNDKVNQLGGPIRDARFCALINEPAHCSAGG